MPVPQYDANVFYESETSDIGSSKDIGYFANGDTAVFTFKIKNVGASSFTISQNGIIIAGTGSIVTDPTSSSSLDISPESTATFTVSKSALSNGSKSFTISFNFGDPESPSTYGPKTVTYTVGQAYSLTFSDSSGSISDGSIVTVGNLDKNSSYTKNVSLKNSGIPGSAGKNISVNSISASGDMTIQSSPSLPYILTPDNANSLNFTLLFNTGSLGSKSGGLNISWSVS